MISLILAAVLLATPAAAPARPRVAPILMATRAPGPVELDGKLTEAAWSSAIPSDAFTQHYPVAAAPASEPTTVRVLYDEGALYVGIDCTQRSTPIVARLTRRDRVVTGDRVTIDISSRSDRVTAFHFGVSAAGVVDDGIYFNDSDYSADWDENWEAETSIRKDGWSVEVKIPFRILRFDAASVQRWGFQVTRYTAARNETDIWAWRPRSAPGFVSTFGTLEGLTGIQPTRPIEARVSGIAKLRFRDAEARGPFAPAHDWAWAFELSGRAHPTQGTTLDLAINPDFGLVEADQVVLNLSNYEVFYPEKRLLFLEGQETWVTPRSVLYTRRIGAQPADSGLAQAGETLVDRVAPSQIWAAAKLVGVTTPRTSVGLLSAVTGKNDALVRRSDGSGTTITRTADPLTLFNVARVRYLAGLGGDVGLLATATNRFEGDRGSGTARTTSDAYVAAIDGRWRSPSTDYVVSGQVVSSVLVGGPPRAHRDGVPVAPGHPDLGLTVTAAKQGGPHWLATLMQSVSGRQLDYNDLGYMERKNDALSYADLTYRTLDAWWKTTDTATTVALSHRQALDGIRLEDHVRLSTSATFTNFWGASATAYYYAPHFDDRETGDGTALERAGLGGAELWVGTDSRRLFTWALWLQAQQLSNGTQVQGSASVVMRPSSRIDLELAPQALYASGEPRFVEKDAAAPFYYFGRLTASNLGLTARATVGLTTRLTLQLYGQLFLATERYTEPSQFRVVGGAFRSEIRLADLQPIAPWSGIPNVQQANLNVNAVLRWEFRLGSTVYLVYTRTQTPSLTPGDMPRLDPSVLSGNRGSTDVIMLKASYWWG